MKKNLKYIITFTLLSSLLLSMTGCQEFIEGFQEGYAEAMAENQEQQPSVDTALAETPVVNNEEPAPEETDVMDYWGINDMDTSNSGEAAPEPQDNETIEADGSGEFVFTSTTIDGDDFDFNDYADSKLIMVNFWEPWCGPCVNEMPELEELYQDYKDQGFVIIGIYSSFDYTDDAYDVIDMTGVTYPIVRYISDFDKYQSGYVPNTIFVNGNGDVLSSEPYVGSMSKAEWEQIVKSYLEN